ncbi:MAG: DUF4331 domain-containing protein [Pseudomonadota bacterium]
MILPKLCPPKSVWKPMLLASLVAASGSALASSHMDAPLITGDDPANTTDVYAFVAGDGNQKYLSTALAVYPFEEPGIGPNAYDFDPTVRYEIHVSLGDDLARGRPTITYRFDFDTAYKNQQTILQGYLGVIENVDDEAQNRTQTYSVTKIDRRERGRNRRELLGSGVVPPNNQGIATPFYNTNNDGEAPARDGVATAAELDRYTSQTVAELDDGYLAFAGQRDDGFYADIQAIFDLLSLRNGDDVFDSQSGFNVHTIVLNIPVEELGGDLQQVGVFATTSRQVVSIFGRAQGLHRQVGRQGNPLFAEGFIALEDKDLYNQSLPHVDNRLFRKYAETPELAALINALIFGGEEVALASDRSDLAGIFIPDVIKVDLSTEAARLAGSGADHATNPDDEGFSRLSIFGGDVLVSQISNGFGDGAVPGGWPNGRRFGDDVVDIAVSAALSDLRDIDNLQITVADGIDNVSANDIGYNKVFPYAATPHNGRNVKHNP